MKLTYDQIISAVNGIVRTEQNDLGLELHRFTRDQEGFFYKTHPLFCTESFFNGYFAGNCRTCAGIYLDFISDAKELNVQLAKTEYAKSSIKRVHLFDLYVDDVLVHSYETNDEIVYHASGEKQRFTLYFPYFAFPVISAVELKEATVFVPQKKQVTILFLGDSITHGATAIHPSNTYVMRVARNMGLGIINQGNSGFVYDAGSIEKVCEPSVIVTAYGINDFMRKDLRQLEKDTVEFFKKLRSVYQNSKILSILPLWTVGDGNNINAKAAQRACLKSIYQKYSDDLVDGFDLVPHDAKYFADQVHPNDAGFAFYGERLTEKLTGILSKTEGLP